MTPTTCDREADIVAAVLGPRLGLTWRGDGTTGERDIDEHLRACGICREVLAVAGALRDDREWMRDLSVPAAGQVWWRAAVRARLEGTQAAARPLTWAHGVAAAAAAGLAVGAAGMAWPAVARGLAWMEEGFRTLGPATPDVAGLIATAVARSAPIAFAVAACAVLAPLALYLALTDD